MAIPSSILVDSLFDRVNPFTSILSFINARPAITHGPLDSTPDQQVNGSAWNAFAFNFTGLGATIVAKIETWTGPAGPDFHIPVYQILCLMDGQKLVPSYPQWPSTTFPQDVIICSTSTELGGYGTSALHNMIVNLTWTGDKNVPPIQLRYAIITDPLTGIGDMYFGSKDGLFATSLTMSDFGWETNDELGLLETKAPGAQLILPFTGVSTAWYGYHASDMRSLATGGEPPSTYSVDGGEESPFDTVPLPEGSLENGTWAMQQLFQTPTYAYGNHTLRVTFKAGNESNRLTLCGLLVQGFNGSDTHLTATALPSPTGRQNRHRAQVGGVTGGVIALVAAIIFGLFILRRRQRVRRIRESSGDEDMAPRPFVTPIGQENADIGPRKARISQQATENPFMHGIVLMPAASKWTRRATYPGGHPILGLDPIATGQEREASLSGSENPPTRANLMSNNPQTHSLLPILPNTGMAAVITEPRAMQSIREGDSGMRTARHWDAVASISDFPPSYSAG